MEVMQICVEQSTHAFRINGVTVAKRHLQKTLGKDCGEDNDKMLAKYLCIVPFLDQAFIVHPDSSESVKYGAYKAKRLYKALGINEDNTVPFMLMCLAQAGDLNIADIGGELRENGFYGEETQSSFSSGGTAQRDNHPVPRQAHTALKAPKVLWATRTNFVLSAIATAIWAYAFLMWRATW